MANAGSNPFESMPTPAHVAAAFEGMKGGPPDIIICHDQKSSEDTAFAKEVAAWLRLNKFTSVRTLGEIMGENMLPGQEREHEYSVGMGKCTHLINISPTGEAEGRHYKTVRKIRAQVEENLDEWQQAVFPLARSPETAEKAREQTPLGIPSIGLWNTEAGKRAFLIRMMDLGPKGKGLTLKDGGRVRNGVEIDWSGSDFAALLGHDVTVQDIDPDMVKDFDDPDRIQKVIIVNMGQTTAHGETISGAFKIEEGFQHGTETDKPPIVCNCAQCGAGRQAFVLDKAGNGTPGVLIIANTKHEGCDVTANISPVPGNTLKKVLNDMFAK